MLFLAKPLMVSPYFFSSLILLMKEWFKHVVERFEGRNILRPK